MLTHLDFDLAGAREGLNEGLYHRVDNESQCHILKSLLFTMHPIVPVIAIQYVKLNPYL